MGSNTDATLCMCYQAASTRHQAVADQSTCSDVMFAGPPPPPPPPPPPGTLGKKRAENADANANGGPQPNCVVLRSPTSQRQRPGSAEEEKATAEQRRRLKQLHWDKLKQAREGTVWSRANRDKLHLDLNQLESLFQVG